MTKLKGTNPPPEMVPNDKVQPMVYAKATLPCQYCMQTVYRGDLCRPEQGFFLHPNCWKKAIKDVEWVALKKAEKIVRSKMKREQKTGQKEMF